MSNPLDNPNTRESYDPQGMIHLAETFHQQCAHGENLARVFELPPASDIRNVVICGMGGSAIGGDLLRAYVADQSPLPIEVVRNYTLPKYVDSHTLVIASSYSGNTEETLSAYAQAKERGAMIVAISTGGELAKQCSEDGFRCLNVPPGLSPRAALGYSFMPLLVFFERWGFIDDQSQAISAMYRAVEFLIGANKFDVALDDNPAKKLAQQLYGSIIVIYASADAFQPIAMRWRCQINENAKAFAHDLSLPEMNHNEILGWKHPASILRHFQAVYLLDQDIHPQTKKRFEVMKSLVTKSAGNLTEIQSTGEGLLARMMSMISFADFVSIYLAYLYQQDPTPIPAIDYLKEELSKKKETL